MVINQTQTYWFGSVCFHSSLTKENSKTLELKQKRSLACILGTDYHNYSHVLGICSLPRLDSLREETTLKWAQGSSQPLTLRHISHKPKHCQHQEQKGTPGFYKRPVTLIVLLSFIVKCQLLSQKTLKFLKKYFNRQISVIVSLVISFYNTSG